MVNFMSWPNQYIYTQTRHGDSWLSTPRQPTANIHWSETTARNRTDSTPNGRNREKNRRRSTTRLLLQGGRRSRHVSPITGSGVQVQAPHTSAGSSIYCRHLDLHPLQYRIPPPPHKPLWQAENGKPNLCPFSRSQTPSLEDEID